MGLNVSSVASRLMTKSFFGLRKVHHKVHYCSKHVQAHKNNRTEYTCETCQFGFSSLNCLKFDFDQISFISELIWPRRSMLEALVYLSASYVESNALAMKTIRWIFISIHYFRNHVKSHKTGQFICQWCKKIFRDEKSRRFRNIKPLYLQWSHCREACWPSGYWSGWTTRPLQVFWVWPNILWDQGIHVGSPRSCKLCSGHALAHLKDGWRTFGKEYTPDIFQDSTLLQDPLIQCSECGQLFPDEKRLALVI